MTLRDCELQSPAARQHLTLPLASWLTVGRLQGKQSTVQQHLVLAVSVLSVPCVSFVVTVFDEDLVDAGANLVTDCVSQVLWVQHPLQQFSLGSALESGLLQLSPQPEDVRLQRLTFIFL